MSRIIPCPIPGYNHIDQESGPVYWVALPDKWLGLHSVKRQAAYDALQKRGVTDQTIVNFAIAIALLDDWALPGVSGNRDAWDLEQIGLPVMGWVSDTVLTEFLACFDVKKNYSPVLRHGWTKKTIPPDGRSTTQPFLQA